MTAGGEDAGAAVSPSGADAAAALPDLGENGLRRLTGARGRLAHHRDLTELACGIATAAVCDLGFDAVSVNLTEPDGSCRVAAAGGAGGLRTDDGVVTERAVVDELLARCVPWGRLRFLDYRRAGEDADALPRWAGHPAGGTGPGPFYPYDVLIAPMRSHAGELVGLVSVDRPRAGRVPTGEQLALLELLAEDAGHAVEERRRTDALADDRDTFRAALAASPLPSAVVDDALVVLAANPAFAQLFGWRPERLTSCSLTSLCDDDGAFEVTELCRAILDGRRNDGALEYGHTHADGRSRRARACFTAVRGLVSGTRLVVHATDVTVSSSGRSSSGRSSSGRSSSGRSSSGGSGAGGSGSGDGATPRDDLGIDELTGLPRRRAALRQIGAALDRRRPGELACVLVLGIDGLARINAAHGPAAGDRVLERVAELVGRTLRAGEQLFRLGGDELAVLCERVGSPGSAEMLARRLATAVAPGVTLPSGQVPVSVCVGIAVAAGAAAPPSPTAAAGTATGAVRGAAELVEAARVALAAAKRRGPGSTSGPPAACG